MKEYTIQVNNLTKVFTKQIRQKGLLGMIKSLFSTKKVKFTAVNDISFSIKKGEMVAYIGANGAGKSTTINDDWHFNSNIRRSFDRCFKAI